LNEGEWLACTDPTPMLEYLRGNASDRRLRLFAGPRDLMLGWSFNETGITAANNDEGC
jgi:hypothetical protein